MSLNLEHIPACDVDIICMRMENSFPRFYYHNSQLHLTNECILWSKVWSDLNGGIENVLFQFLHIYP